MPELAPMTTARRFSLGTPRKRKTRGGCSAVACGSVASWCALEGRWVVVVVLIADGGSFIASHYRAERDESKLDPAMEHETSRAPARSLAFARRAS
jgi:hypothetical protein